MSAFRGQMAVARPALASFAVVVALIIYGSLYPFEFRIPANGNGALSALRESWSARPSRGDFVANILLYMPFGWFGIRSLPRRMSPILRVLIVAGGGTALSAAMELSQYYDAERVTSAIDLCTNLLGAVLGGAGAIGVSADRPAAFLGEITEKPVPVALLAAWAGYRLYPYVPTVDLHKYWNALKPVILNPHLSFDDLCRHTAIWLTIFALVDPLVRERRWKLLAAATVAAGALIGRIMIVDAVLSVAEVVGALVAICLWPLLLALSPRSRAAIVLVFLGSTVVIERLEPFQFQLLDRRFGWMPFRSFLAGSIAVDIMSFFEKTFLYGSLLALCCKAGWRLGTAVLVVGGVLFGTSWAETYLPGRSGEVTDMIMALLLGGGLALAGFGRDSDDEGAAARAKRVTGTRDAA